MFVNSFLDIADLESSMFEFQAYLKYTGRGQEISNSQIKDCIDKRDNKRLKTLLEELLLIRVDNTEIEKFFKHTDYADLEDFIDKIKVCEGYR